MAPVARPQHEPEKRALEQTAKINFDFPMPVSGFARG
jgi:hypothetical protein